MSFKDFTRHEVNRRNVVIIDGMNMRRIVSLCKKYMRITIP